MVAARRHPKLPARRRPHAAPPAHPVQTGRTLARRADLFDGREGDHNIGYRRSEEGVIHLIGTRLQGLDLVVLTRLCQLYLQRGEAVTLGPERRVVVRVTTYELARLVYGVRKPGQRHYVALRASLGRLTAAVLDSHSAWHQPRPHGLGRETRVTLAHQAHLIDDIVTISDGGYDAHGIVLANLLQRELLAGDLTLLPEAILRLGTRNGAALRLAHHVLSHQPVSPATRKARLETVDAVVAPDPGHARAR